MKTYCISCHKDTDCLRHEIVKSKNNRLILRSVCSVCKKNKSRFYGGLSVGLQPITQRTGGNIDIHSKILPLLPKKGLTLPGYKYCRPGNPLDNGNPVNELDAICQKHDYCYSNPNVDKNECDKKNAQ